MKSAFLLTLALALAASGCSSFMHASDPTMDDVLGRLCAGKAEDARPAIEAESQRSGVPLASLLAAFKTACLFRASQGVNDAAGAGMDGVHREGATVGCQKLTPENALGDLSGPAVEEPALKERQ